MYDLVCMSLLPGALNREEGGGSPGAEITNSFEPSCVGTGN